MGPLPRYIFSSCYQAINHSIGLEGAPMWRICCRASARCTIGCTRPCSCAECGTSRSSTQSRPLGFVDEKMSLDILMDLWGPDPVHPSQEAYHILADKIAEFCDNWVSTPKDSLDRQQQPQQSKRPSERELWIERSEPVAKGQNLSNENHFRGSRRFTHSHRGHGGRGLVKWLH